MKFSIIAVIAQAAAADSCQGYTDLQKCWKEMGALGNGAVNQWLGSDRSVAAETAACDAWQYIFHLSGCPSAPLDCANCVTELQNSCEQVDNYMNSSAWFSAAALNATTGFECEKYTGVWTTTTAAPTTDGPTTSTAAVSWPLGLALAAGLAAA